MSELDHDTPPQNPLELAEHLIRLCTRCPLSKTRANAVPGEGPPDARVVLIGEAPGQNEDKHGRPFVGAAGQLLDKLLPTAGLSRSEVYITNILKCRPPENRDPLPQEIEACSRHLEIQLGLINPELVITLGAFSLQHFFTGETVGKSRGRLRNQNGRFIYPVMHPAAALRRQDFNEKVSQDFLAIPQVLETLRTDPPPAEAPVSHAATQSALF